MSQPYSAWSASLLALCFAGCLTPGAAAQDLPLAGAGARVRLTLDGAGGPKAIGWLTKVGPDSLVLQEKPSGGIRVLLRSSVRQVEVSLSRQPDLARGVGLGALFGSLAAGGFVFVLSAMTPSCNDPARESGGWTWCHDVSASNLLRALAVGAATGAGIGYRHAQHHPRDLWAPAQWEGMAPARTASRPVPLVGLGRADGRRVLFLGVSFAR